MIFGLFRKRGKEETKKEHLPEGLIMALRDKSYPDMSEQLRLWCECAPSDVREGVLIEAAEGFGWDSEGRRKIIIFSRFYLKNYVGAFEAARGFVEPDESFDADVFTLCLNILYRNNQFEDAFRLLDRIPFDFSLLSNRDDYWILRALIVWASGKVDLLKHSIDKAISISPDSPVVMENALSMYWELGEIELFECVRERFVSLGFSNSYGYSLAVLAAGDYKEGFSLMEARYDMEEAERYINKALLAHPRWKGVSLREGKTLLVSAEQGIGDSIQMARYFEALASSCGGSVTAEVQSELVSLFEFNFPDVTFLPRIYGSIPPMLFDGWVGMMSFPFLFDTDIDNAPEKQGYIRAPDYAVEYWRERLSGYGRGGRLKIGLAWSGQPAHRADRRRSISFELISTLVSVSDNDFFALQKSVPDLIPGNLVDLSEELITMADTAGVIQHMDLVVTVDTSVVHLSGSMGVNTLLLLPFRYEWRWGVEGEKNPWYESVRVVRQSMASVWDDPVRDVFLNKIPEIKERILREHDY